MTDKKEIPLSARIGIVTFTLFCLIWVASPPTSKVNYGNKNFSSVDGSNIAFKLAVKKQLADPKSFRHIVTTHEDFESLGKTYILMKFKANNSYGVIEEAVAHGYIDLDGNVISVNIQQFTK